MIKVKIDLSNQNSLFLIDKSESFDPKIEIEINFLNIF